MDIRRVLEDEMDASLAFFLLEDAGVDHEAMLENNIQERIEQVCNRALFLDRALEERKQASDAAEDEMIDQLETPHFLRAAKLQTKRLDETLKTLKESASSLKASLAQTSQQLNTQKIYKQQLEKVLQALSTSKEVKPKDPNISNLTEAATSLGNHYVSK